MDCGRYSTCYQPASLHEHRGSCDRQHICKQSCLGPSLREKQDFLLWYHFCLLGVILVSGCAAHGLNLLAKDILGAEKKDSEFAPLVVFLASVQEIVRCFRKSTLLSAEIAEKQKLEGKR